MLFFVLIIGHTDLRRLAYSLNTHFRRAWVPGVGPSGINLPFEDVVGSIGQVGDHNGKKRFGAACVPGELKHASKDLRIRVKSIVEPVYFLY
jgi:hypothetical protein